MISEFRVRGPVGGNDEFVELYNLSSSPVDISGWKIKGSNNAAGTSVRLTVQAGTVLNPGCHFLATNSNIGGPYSGSVPGDQRYGTGITDDGGIVLTRGDDSVVDQVGMSSGSAFKEGTPLTSLGSLNLDREYERMPGSLAGNGTDTDNNAGDFLLVSPSNPQNLSSACIADTGPTPPTGVGAASPASLVAGEQATLVVTVTPGANPISSGIAVAADLGAIGGSSTQSFFDDGSNGDVTAGDNVCSFNATVSPGTSVGAKSLPFVVSDVQVRSSPGSIILMVVPPPMPIHSIQGAGSTSPFVGQLVTTHGIVTARRFNNGFFIQTPDALVDGDPNTSEGDLRVHEQCAAGHGVGRRLRPGDRHGQPEFVPDPQTVHRPPRSRRRSVSALCSTYPMPIGGDADGG